MAYLYQTAKDDLVSDTSTDEDGEGSLVPEEELEEGENEFEDTDNADKEF